MTFAPKDVLLVIVDREGRGLLSTSDEQIVKEERVMSVGCAASPRHMSSGECDWKDVPASAIFTAVYPGIPRLHDEVLVVKAAKDVAVSDRVRLTMRVLGASDSETIFVDGLPVVTVVTSCARGYDLGTAPVWSSADPVHRGRFDRVLTAGHRRAAAGLVRNDWEIGLRYFTKPWQEGGRVPRPPWANTWHGHVFGADHAVVSLADMRMVSAAPMTVLFAGVSGGQIAVQSYHCYPPSAEAAGLLVGDLVTFRQRQQGGNMPPSL